MSLALLGILSLQVHQLSRALSLNRETFDRSVNEALREVVERLQDSELRTSYVRYSRQLELQIPQPDTAQAEGLGADAALLTPEEAMRLGPQRVRIRDSLAIVTEQETYLNLDPSFLGGEVLTFIQESTQGRDSSLTPVPLGQDPRLLPLRMDRSTGLEDIQRTLEAQLDTTRLDSLIGRTLRERDLPGRYRFGLSVAGEAAPPFPSDERSYQAQLFPSLPGNQKGALHLYFPQRERYVLQTIWLQAALALLFGLIIGIGFWLAVRTIYRQKRLSEMKNDFINNMTHELKTPIATISLATEAIDNPRIRSSTEKLDRYSRIIREENKRMHRQVERVLLAARFDRGELTLNREPTDLHALIESAAANLELQIQERQGRLTLDLQAPRSVLEVDRDHLSNVVYNLLDNANKYSPDAPQITVRTRHRNGFFLIQVQDQGIGISSADQQDIFTRFFRVSTGNLHEVKGFGLGLSYVRELAEAHGGKVEVQSAPGRGSTFTVFLPLTG